MRGEAMRENTVAAEPQAMTTAGLQAKVALRRAWFEAHPNQPIPEGRAEVERLFVAIEEEARRASDAQVADVEPPFVVRQFEGTPWVPLHEAARLHDAHQAAELRVVAAQNEAAALREHIRRYGPLPVREAAPLCAICGQHHLPFGQPEASLWSALRSALRDIRSRIPSDQHVALAAIGEAITAIGKGELAMQSTEPKPVVVHAGISYPVSIRVTPGGGMGSLDPDAAPAMWSVDVEVAEGVSLTASGESLPVAIEKIEGLIVYRMDASDE